VEGGSEGGGQATGRLALATGGLTGGARGDRATGGSKEEELVPGTTKKMTGLSIHNASFK
jgi:hypothetical protein